MHKVYGPQGHIMKPVASLVYFFNHHLPIDWVNMKSRATLELSLVGTTKSSPPQSTQLEQSYLSFLQETIKHCLAKVSHHMPFLVVLGKCSLICPDLAGGKEQLKSTL